MTYDDWKTTVPDLYDYEPEEEPQMTDFDEIRNRIRAAHLDALRALDAAEAASKVADVAAPALADTLAAIVSLAPGLAAHTYRISLGHGDDVLMEALAALPGAKRSVYYYRADEPSAVDGEERSGDEVIPHVEVMSGGVSVECSGMKRPATPEEIAAEYAHETVQAISEAASEVIF